MDRLPTGQPSEIIAELEAQICNLREEVKNARFRLDELARQCEQLREQNKKLVRKSIDLADVKIELDDKNFELELIKGDLERRVEERTEETRKKNEYLKQHIALRHQAEAKLRETAKEQGRLLQETARARDELQIREQWYRTTFEHTGTAMMVLESDATVGMVNSRFEIISGYSRQEVEGKKKWTEFVDPEDLDRLLEYQRDQQRHGALPSSYEFLLLNRQGYHRYIFAIVKPIPGTDKYIASLLDITERKLAEQALQREKERFQLLVENAPLAVLLLRQDGVFEYANQRFTEIFGYTQSEITCGREWFRKAFPDPENRHRVISHWIADQQAIREGRHSDYTYEVICRDGSQKIVLFRPVALPGDSGHLVIMEDISERKRAESALRESEERHRTLLEEMPYPVVVYDMKGQAILINAAFEQTFGWNRDELLGKAVSFVPQEAKEETRLRVKSMLRGQPVRGFSTKRLTKAGDILDVEISSAPFYNQLGQQQGNIILLQDVTDLKRAEIAIRESENKYRLLAENVSDVLWVLDIERLVFTHVSPSVVRQWGFSPEEAIARPLAHSLTPPSLELAARTLSEELERENDPEADPARTRTLDVEIIRKDGTTIWAEITCSFMRGQDGRPNALIGVSRDISERRSALEQARQNEEKYRLVLEVSPDPVVLYDMEGKVLYLNPAFTRVFGWTLDELLGCNIDYVPPEEWPRTREMLEVMKQGRVLFGFETRRFNKRGDILDIALSWSVWRDRQGQPAGSIIILRDITETKKLQAQLEQARKMEAIGTLAGGIAHDLNNVLQAISGNVQLLLIKADLERVSRDCLVDMDRLIQRAADTIQQLLTMSRKKASRLEPMSVNQEINHVLRLLERILPKMITVEVNLASDLDLINGDPAQMEQIVLNLAGNAVDAMPDGGRLMLETANLDLDEVFCRTHPETRPGPYVLIQVADTGQGIEPQALEHIFEPFFTTKPLGQGTGLGLSTVYSIVKAHQGLISCYSLPGQGTVFKIYLPAFKGSALSDGRERAAAQELRGGGETILLVDDEPDILRIGCEILEIFGYQVLQAVSGEEALAICQERPGGVDLVILDLNMPGMGGLRCLEQLLKLVPPVRVVISSGYPTDNIAQDLRSAGAAGFIGKPYRLNDMVARVRQILDSGQAT